MNQGFTCFSCHRGVGWNGLMYSLNEKNEPAKRYTHTYACTYTYTCLPNSISKNSYFPKTGKITPTARSSIPQHFSFFYLKVKKFFKQESPIIQVIHNWSGNSIPKIPSVLGWLLQNQILKWAAICRDPCVWAMSQGSWGSPQAMNQVFKN